MYNPQAGKLRSRGRERLEHAARVLRDGGYKPVLTPTTGAGAATELARRAVADGADLILAAGGDGTVNEVAEGMVNSRVPLGILPAGTANVLAMETGMSSNLETAARALLDYTPERVSVGRLHFQNGAAGARHFLLMAGIGIDARAIYHLSAPLKDNLGKLAYWISAFALLGRQLEEFAVTVDHRRYSCSFALVSKVRNYGGDLEIARDTSLFDDQFEVVLFHGRNSIRYLRYFVGVVLNRLRGMDGVSVLRASSVSLSSVPDERVYMQIDGEYVGRLPGSIELVKDAITLLLPPSYKQRVAASPALAVH
ncbi:MAG TPA: diacylglycerol kinase family protein [Candidatus Binataceae bacterium]|nr:diacylglycerol kinase family protein [Candidatus Binataceae bacterium]